MMEAAHAYATFFIEYVLTSGMECYPKYQQLKDWNITNVLHVNELQKKIPQRNKQHADPPIKGITWFKNKIQADRNNI